MFYQGRSLDPQCRETNGRLKNLLMKASLEQKLQAGKRAESGAGLKTRENTVGQVDCKNTVDKKNQKICSFQEL